MTLDYQIVLDKGELNSDVASIIPSLRTIYAHAKTFLELTSRFQDSQFQDAFDNLTFIGSDDYGAYPSQMIFNVSTLITAWEASAEYRAVLGLAPL